MERSMTASATNEPNFTFELASKRPTAASEHVPSQHDGQATRSLPPLPFFTIPSVRFAPVATKLALRRSFKVPAASRAALSDLRRLLPTSKSEFPRKFAQIGHCPSPSIIGVFPDSKFRPAASIVP